MSKILKIKTQKIIKINIPNKDKMKCIIITELFNILYKLKSTLLIAIILIKIVWINDIIIIT
jgi:hypothetical protein